MPSESSHFEDGAANGLDKEWKPRGSGKASQVLANPTEEAFPFPKLPTQCSYMATACKQLAPKGCMYVCVHVCENTSVCMGACRGQAVVGLPS